MTSKTIPHNISILQHEGDAALTKVSVVEDDPPPPPNVSPPRSPSPPWPERATDEEDESAEEIAVTPIRRLRTPSPGPRESLRSLYNVLAPAKTRPQDAPRTPTTTPAGVRKALAAYRNPATPTKVVKKLFLYTCTPATGVKRKRADDDEDDKENEDGSVAAENSGSTPV